MAKIPNLNMLYTFSRAAHLKSFKDAATELHITPTAVSHQMRKLEDVLGQPLFIRLTREKRDNSWLMSVNRYLPSCHVLWMTFAVKINKSI